MNGEQKAGHERNVGLAADDRLADCQYEDGSHAGVQQDVGEMVAERIEAREKVVETERQNAERPVGLVWAAVSQWSAPEVIDQQVPQRRVGQQVHVLHDRSATQSQTADSNADPLAPTVPDRVKPSFVIFDIRTLWRSWLSVIVPECQKLQMTA